MLEHEQIEIGCYCQSLMEDPNFNHLVGVCEAQFSLEMLESETEADREKTHRTFKGLKALLELMRQFVIVKDQIVARQEQEENK